MYLCEYCTHKRYRFIATSHSHASKSMMLAKPTCSHSKIFYRASLEIHSYPHSKGLTHVLNARVAYSRVILVCRFIRKFHLACTRSYSYAKLLLNCNDFHACFITELCTFFFIGRLFCTHVHCYTCVIVCCVKRGVKFLLLWVLNKLPTNYRVFQEVNI